MSSSPASSCDSLKNTEFVWPPDSSPTEVEGLLSAVWIPGDWSDTLGKPPDKNIQFQTLFSSEKLGFCFPNPETHTRQFLELWRPEYSRSRSKTLVSLWVCIDTFLIFTVLDLEILFNSFSSPLDFFPGDWSNDAPFHATVLTVAFILTVFKKSYEWLMIRTRYEKQYLDIVEPDVTNNLSLSIIFSLSDPLLH